ncbi:MAG TPA: aromatic ring-hydroxylating dioxygenase subunit alpha [Kofleriaceae bacterium]|nr:aromatic ring-hydroxylating dioxygenase subunit alpha [Kofleriaceae bacterium]
MFWPAERDRDQLRAEVARFDPDLPIERAFTPPGSWYVDRRFHDLDRRAVFGRSWLPACRAELVAEPGAYASGCIAGLPWVVVRGDDGVLRGFHNSCRHKGREVVIGAGRADQALVCGYHAWTYALDGRLRTAPRMAGVEAFDRPAMSLVPLAVEAWGPWVFLHVDPAARPLAPRLPELERRLVARGWDRYRYVGSAEWVVEANWKTVVDNYLDGGYHVPHMHPSLRGQIDMDRYTTDIFADYSIQHAPAAPDPDPGLAVDARARIGEGAIYAWIHPCFMINVYGPCIDTNVVVPLGHDRCRIEYDFFFAIDQGEAGERFVRDSMAQSAVTQAEDKEICESVQIGLQSPSYDHGRYAPRLEMGEHHFHRLLSADYRDALGS